MFLARFGHNGAEILLVKSDRNLGGRDLDYVVMKKLGKEFKEQNDTETDPSERPKIA